MINFKFVRTQFKNILVPIIVFVAVLIILIIPALTQPYFAPSVTREMIGSIPSTRYHLGAAMILANVYFGIPGFITIIVFSILLINILLTKEIDRGYFASWLTAGMSRKTVLNSKFFVLVSSFLIVYFAAFLFQIIFFSFLLKDFSGEVFLRILLYNFALLLLALLWTAINWVIICFFDKPAAAIGIAAAVSAFFVICTSLPQFAAIWNVDFLKYFKYLTITSLLNAPFSFIPPALPDSGTAVGEMLPIRTLDFAWQLPVMFALPFGLYPLGKMLIVRKDLQL